MQLTFMAIIYTGLYNVCGYIELSSVNSTYKVHPGKEGMYFVTRGKEGRREEEGEGEGKEEGRREEEEKVDGGKRREWKKEERGTYD